MPRLMPHTIFDHRSVTGNPVDGPHRIEAGDVLGVHTGHPLLATVAQFLVGEASESLAAEAIDAAADKVNLEHHAASRHRRIPEQLVARTQSLALDPAFGEVDDKSDHLFAHALLVADHRASPVQHPHPAAIVAAHAVFLLVALGLAGHHVARDRHGTLAIVW